MTHLVKHVRQSAAFLISFYNENEFSVSRRSSRQANHQEQDVTIIQSLFFWFYPKFPQPHHLIELPRRRYYILITFSLVFSTHIRWLGELKPIFFTLNNKRSPTHKVNLLFYNEIRYEIGYDGK